MRGEILDSWHLKIDSILIETEHENMNLIAW